MSVSKTADAEHHSLRFVIVVVIVAALGGLLFGYDTGVISGAIGFLKVQYNMSPGVEGFVTGSITLGAMVGVVVAGMLGDKFGRKKALMLAGILFILSSLLAALAQTITVLVIGRMIGGLAVGLASLLSPMYIAEIAPPKIRGRLVGANQLAIVTGIFIVYFVNALLVSTHTAAWGQAVGWRWMFGMGIIPGLLFFLLLFMVPESPRFLIAHGKSEEALTILNKVSGPKVAKIDYESIEQSVRIVPDAFFKDIFRPGIRKAVLIGILLSIFQQFTGTNAVGYYAPLIFKAAGAGSNASFYDTVWIGAIKVIFVIVLMLIVDKIGRKRLLVWNAVFMTIFLIILAWAFSLPHIITYFVLALVFLHTIAYELSWGGGVWIIISEIYPTAIRGRAMSIASFALWGATYLVAQFFPILLASIGGTWTFLVFAFFCVVMAIFMKRVVPETSGKTMEKIQADWINPEQA